MINPDIKREYDRIYDLAFPEKRRERVRKRYLVNPEPKLAAARRYYERHPEKCRQRTRAYIEKNPDYQKNYRAADPERERQRQRADRRKHLDARRKNAREYVKTRYHSDPNYRMKFCLRARLYGALRGHRKSASTMSLLGCSIDDLWIYLESKFEEGMTKDNYGQYWQIDHIIPCDIFDLTNHEHQRRCFHFSNLQPLLEFDNKSKGARLGLEYKNI